MSEKCQKPGTMEAIFNAMCDFAISDLDHSAHSSRHPFTTIRTFIANAKKYIAALRSQLAAEKELREAAEARAAGLTTGIDDAITILDGFIEDSGWGCQRGYVLAESVRDASAFLAALLAPAAEPPIICKSIGEGWRIDKAPEELEDDEGADDGK